MIIVQKSLKLSIGELVSGLVLPVFFRVLLNGVVGEVNVHIVQVLKGKVLATCSKVSL